MARRSRRHSSRLLGTESACRCVSRLSQYPLSFWSLSWRVSRVRLARCSSRGVMRWVATLSSTFRLASRASWIFSGVLVTVTKNQPLSMRSKTVSSNATSYVSPRASRTVVKSRELMISVSSMSVMEEYSGCARRMALAAECASGVFSMASGATGGTISPAARLAGVAPASSICGLMAFQRLGAGPAMIAIARSSESFRCQAWWNMAGSSGAWNLTSGEGMTCVWSEGGMVPR
mmetsp:Transcript_36872/g.66018  ORF Transcript_36872/g.66018 Transcript_36872/m.66018 type:complete len:233 (+) Transcript_36872:707-1405(+)